MKGDSFAALPWLVESLRLEEGNPQAEAACRARLGAVLRECPRPAGIFSAPDVAVLDADLSADGRRLATAHEDDQVRLWEVAIGRLLERLPHGFPVHHCRFLASGDSLLTCTYNRQAHVWRLTPEPPGAVTLPHWVSTWSEPTYTSSLNRKTDPVQVI